MEIINSEFSIHFTKLNFHAVVLCIVVEVEGVGWDCDCEVVVLKVHLGIFLLHNIRYFDVVDP